MSEIENPFNNPDRGARSRLIIAVDGEGKDIPFKKGDRREIPDDVRRKYLRSEGVHTYTMLAAVGNRGAGREIETEIHYDPDVFRLQERQYDEVWDDEEGTMVNVRRAKNDDTARARNYGLATKDCLEFLLNLTDDRGVVVTSFYFSYDVTKILVDLPLFKIKELAENKRHKSRRWEIAREIEKRFGIAAKEMMRFREIEANSTVWGDYLIHYLPRKSFTVIDLRAGRIEVEPATETRRARYEWAKNVVVWDVFGFFQKSFVKALVDNLCHPTKCVGPENERKCHLFTTAKDREVVEMIERMKAERAHFDDMPDADVLAYCYQECEYLVRLMRDLLGHFEDMGLKMNRFDGSGAVAQAWMQKEKVKNYFDKNDRDSGLPHETAKSAYYGGRFEVSVLGPVGNVTQYDINSAYPTIARDLPCLAHGRFVRLGTEGIERRFHPDKVGVYLAGANTAGRWGPFPFRPDRDFAKYLTAELNRQHRPIPERSVFYPHGARRWVWNREIEVARAHFASNDDPTGAKAIPLYDGWVFLPECDHKPFAELQVIYDKRKELKRLGNPAEGAYKLLLNSVYGKLAQSEGAKLVLDKETGRWDKFELPTFTSYIWAGMITSGTRAMILDAILTSGNVVSIATDGILATEPIPTTPEPTNEIGGPLYVPNEKILGAWEATTYEDGWIFQSGVYSVVDPKKGYERTTKTRGFTKREIPPETLISAWNAGKSRAFSSADETRFVGLRGGSHATYAFDLLGQWVPAQKQVDFSHSRRLTDSDEMSGLPLMPFEGEVIPSAPYEFPDVYPHTETGENTIVVSAPYRPKVTAEDLLALEFGEDDVKDRNDGDFFEADKDDLSVFEPGRSF